MWVFVWKNKNKKTAITLFLIIDIFISNCNLITLFFFLSNCNWLQLGYIYFVIKLRSLISLHVTSYFPTLLISATTHGYVYNNNSVTWYLTENRAFIIYCNCSDAEMFSAQ